MRYLVSVILLLVPLCAAAQPDTDIYLFDLRIKDDELLVSRPVNITNRKGYDNQPSFHPDQNLLYYVSADTAGETDIMIYDLRKRATHAFTNTPDREYSPALTPDRQYISSILQRSNGAQDLVRYPVKGGAAEVLIDHLTCGYYAFVSNDVVCVFALPAPFTLHVVDLTTRSDTVIADSIGRSLQRIPGESAVAFVEKKSGALIRKWDGKKKQVSPVAPALGSREYDMAFGPGGVVVMSDGGKLFYSNPSKSLPWRELKINVPLTGDVTRVAINSAGTKMAVVVAE